MTAAAIVIAVLLAIVAAANFYFGRLPAQPSAGGAFVQVGRRKLHYLESPGAELPIVFIHGMPGLGREFDPIREKLPSRRTLAFDRPGYGWSTGGPLDFDGQVDAIADALSRLGIERALIAGHSFGGMVALGLALEHPELVDRLLLLAPAAGGTRLPDKRVRLAKVIKFLELPVIRQIADVFFLRVLRRVASEQGALLAYGVDEETAQQRHYAESVLARHPSIRAMANDRILFNEAGRSIDGRLGEIEVPTLIVHGTADASVPIRNGRRIAAAIPGAEFKEVAADHVLPGKFSDVVVAAAADFIAADQMVS